VRVRHSRNSYDVKQAHPAEWSCVFFAILNNVLASRSAAMWSAGQPKESLSQQLDPAAVRRQHPYAIQRVVKSKPRERENRSVKHNVGIK
jgi:hypothetical protein